MKQLFSFLILSCFTLSSMSQITPASNLEKLESSFDTLKVGCAIPCAWKVDRRTRNNGKAFFIAYDSTIIEFEYFKVKTLPFYTYYQTGFETSLAWYHWKNRNTEYQNNLALTILEENKEKGFVIYKIKDDSEDFYRMLYRVDDIFFSIKLFSTNTMTSDAPLEKLRLLHRLNKGIMPE